MTFAIGDKVMQIENDYDKEVYNGDIGFVGGPVAYGSVNSTRSSSLTRQRSINRKARNFPLSSFPSRHSTIGCCSAGVTRGKRLVILPGQKKAVAIAVKNVSGRRRWSKLREWLNPAGFSIPRLINA